MKNMLKVLRIILVLTAAMQVFAGAPENDQEIHENPDRMKYRPLTIQDRTLCKTPEARLING